MAVASQPVDSENTGADVTEPLRRLHFSMWIVLSALLVALFAAGLIVRRPTISKNPRLSWEKYR